MDADGQVEGQRTRNHERRDCHPQISQIHRYPRLRTPVANLQSPIARLRLTLAVCNVACSRNHALGVLPCPRRSRVHANAHVATTDCQRTRGPAFFLRDQAARGAVDEVLRGMGPSLWLLRPADHGRRLHRSREHRLSRQRNLYCSLSGQALPFRRHAVDEGH